MPIKYLQKSNCQTTGHSALSQTLVMELPVVFCQSIGILLAIPDSLIGYAGDPPILHLRAEKKS